MPTLKQRFAFQQLEVYQVAKAVAQLTIEQRARWANLPGGMGERLATAMTSLLTEIAAGAAQNFLIGFTPSAAFPPSASTSRRGPTPRA